MPSNLVAALAVTCKGAGVTVTAVALRVTA